MISKATPKFWKCFHALPRDIQAKAKDAYTLFRDNPWYPSLNFKRVHSGLPVYSVRITKDYRAVGMLGGDKIVWFWAGTHSDYDTLLKLRVLETVYLISAFAGRTEMNTLPNQSHSSNQYRYLSDRS